MKHVKLVFLSALMLGAQAAFGQTFIHNGILYQAQQGGKAKVVKVYNYENITIPDTVSDGNRSFAVSEVSGNSFYCLYNLRLVYLPKTLRHICKDAFVDCKNLRAMEVGAQEPPLCDVGAFCTVDLKKVSLVVPDGCQRAYMEANPWSEACEIVEPSAHKDGKMRSKRTRK